MLLLFPRAYSNLPKMVSLIETKMWNWKGVDQAVRSCRRDSRGLILVALNNKKPGQPSFKAALLWFVSAAASVKLWSEWSVLQSVRVKIRQVSEPRGPVWLRWENKGWTRGIVCVKRLSRSTDGTGRMGKVWYSCFYPKVETECRLPAALHGWLGSD